MVPRDMPGTGTGSWNTRICVLGVGFVGRSLLRQFGKFYECIGYDISEQSVEEASRHLTDLEKVELTTDQSMLGQATHFLIAVPTPVRKDRSVNLDFVYSALEAVIEFAKPGCSIIIESSVPVGATRQLLGTFQNDFHCGMSPERIDPGRASPTPTQIPKIVSGLTRRAQKQLVALYQRVYETVIPVSSPEVAEMTKLYENCFRMINVAYVNEISDACYSYKINPHEVISAAATKPFGFLPFYPGLGVGGHCIPANAQYLLSGGPPLPCLEQAASLMNNRPLKLATRFYRRSTRTLSNNELGLIGHKPRILVVGVAFKAGQSDALGSPSVSFAKRLNELGCESLSFYDPLIEEGEVDFMQKLPRENWTTSYLDSEFDAIAVCIRQSKTDLNILGQLKRCMIQTYV